MTDTLACDVSYYQAAADDSYPHPWLIFRVCDGTFRDPKFALNRVWAEKACRSGKLVGYTVYCVYRPGVDVFSVVQSMVGKPSKHVTVMVDVESWSGQIRGDHSSDITALVNKLAKWLGTAQRVLAYGNQGDLASIYPHRPDWLRLVVAAYSSVKPDVHNMIGWQYSDGTDRWPLPAGLPRSSKPFGNCDHNIFPGLTPAQLAAELGVGTQHKHQHQEEPKVSLISAAKLSRAIEVGGQYATAKLKKRFPTMVREEGVRAQVDRVEKDEKQTASLVAKLSAEVEALKKGAAK
jgi:hypothetical protein